MSFCAFGFVTVRTHQESPTGSTTDRVIRAFSRMTGGTHNVKDCLVISDSYIETSRSVRASLPLGPVTAPWSAMAS